MEVQIIRSMDLLLIVKKRFKEKEYFLVLIFNVCVCVYHLIRRGVGGGGAGAM